MSEKDENMELIFKHQMIKKKKKRKWNSFSVDTYLFVTNSRRDYMIWTSIRIGHILNLIIDQQRFHLLLIWIYQLNWNDWVMESTIYLLFIFFSLPLPFDSHLMSISCSFILTFEFIKKQMFLRHKWNKKRKREWKKKIQKIIFNIHHSHRRC